MMKTMDEIEETDETREIDEIELVKKKIKLCDRITIAAIILIVVCLLSSFLVSKFMKDRELALTVVRGLTGVLIALPVAAMAPLFFRTNLKIKLTVLLREK